MQQTTQFPVISVGALGGSGTRVVAQILMDLGIYMGDILNKSNDNLVFTFLFKNPKWLENAEDYEIYDRLRIFEKYMENEILSGKESMQVVNALLSFELFRRNYIYYPSFIINYYFKKSINHNRWGWKEPNNQIFLPFFIRHFKHLKYIHVVRHGLDMAFSSNKQQLLNWGWKYGLDVNGKNVPLPHHQLEYWIRSNNQTIEEGHKALDKGFYILNYDQFCINPQDEVPKLLDFLDLTAPENVLNKLISLPKIPNTMGRYKNRDLSIFSKSQLQAVEDLGFSI